MLPVAEPLAGLRAGLRCGFPETNQPRALGRVVFSVWVSFLPTNEYSSFYQKVVFLDVKI